jgi:hypothetical protein
MNRGAIELEYESKIQEVPREEDTGVEYLYTTYAPLYDTDDDEENDIGLVPDRVAPRRDTPRLVPDRVPPRRDTPREDTSEDPQIMVVLGTIFVSYIIAFLSGCFITKIYFIV